MKKISLVSLYTYFNQLVHDKLLNNSSILGYSMRIENSLHQSTADIFIPIDFLQTFSKKIVSCVISFLSN